MSLSQGSHEINFERGNTERGEEQNIVSNSTECSRALSRWAGWSFEADNPKPASVSDLTRRGLRGSNRHYKLMVGLQPVTLCSENYPVLRTRLHEHRTPELITITIDMAVSASSAAAS